MKKVYAGLTLALFAPFLAGAQGLFDNGSGLTGVESFVRDLGDIVDLLIPIAFAAAVLFFFWGLAKYILSAGDTEKREQGRNIMIWGVIALFVMASVWGLVAFIGDFFGVDQNANVGGGSANVPEIRD